jgi:L-serine kinase (ADP)
MSGSKALPHSRARPAARGSSHERPHLDVRFELIAIDKLLPHEEVQHALLERLTDEIDREKVVREPILVADEHFVVLNGHHRLAALRALGVRKVPAWVVAYFSDVVDLTAWPDASPQHIVSKHHVVGRAKEGKLYPPKTTRHRLKVELPERTTHLDDLR